MVISVKKVKRLFLVGLVCLFICAVTAGCVGDSAQNNDGDEVMKSSDKVKPNNETNNGVNKNNNGAIKTMGLTAKELEPPLGHLNYSAQTVAGGANDFAFRLSATLLADEPGSGNFICSPYSVWLPLAALVNATNETHKENLRSALSATGISDADINSTASRMLYDLTKQSEKQFSEEYDIPFYDPLKITNAVFIGKNVTLKKDFAQTFLDYYRGDAITVDFSNKKAVDAVNAWASENTEGLISEIVREFDPGTVAAIANAIYFSDRWEWEFNPDQTVEDVFHSPSGDTAAFFMKREGDTQVYYEDDNIQAMPLRFKTGGGMYIILPKDGDAIGLLSSMTSAYLDGILESTISASGKLLLPRFSIESDIMNLKDALVALGVPLFDASTAPLTGGLVEEDIPLWISDAVQKAVIEVDEKGTTAAAVTVMPADGASPPQPTEPFEMICDIPFVFVLYSHTYDGGFQVLFTGVVNQP